MNVNTYHFAQVIVKLLLGVYTLFVDTSLDVCYFRANFFHHVVE